MKVGFVCRFPPEKDGIGETYVHLVNELRKSITIITIGTRKSGSDYRINLESFSLKKKLAEIVRKESLDALHIQYIAPFYGKFTLNINLLNALNLKIPIVTTLHEVQYSLNGLKKKILCAIEKRIIKKSDVITVHTPMQGEFLSKKYAAKNIECVYMGICQKELHPRRKNNILFFGILSKLKGLDYLIDAMKSLPECNLRIVCSMPDKSLAEYRDYLQGRINTEKISNIELVSREWFTQEEKHSHYQWADVVALPYVWGDYQSAVMTDAVAYGLPVIVTKVGAIWEMAERFKCGAIINTENSDEISNGIKLVFADYDKYRKGILEYRKVADWKSISKRYIQIYNIVDQQDN